MLFMHAKDAKNSFDIVQKNTGRIKYRFQDACLILDMSLLVWKLYSDNTPIPYHHQYHGVLVRRRCSCGDTFTCNCPILVLNKVYYYYYYYYSQHCQLPLVLAICRHTLKTNQCKYTQWGKCTL